MAPVGSFAALQAAIASGADSVFFGVKQLNMRARSSYNFELDEIQVVADRCHKAKVRSYITLNTLLYEHDMALMKKIITTAKEAGIDEIIVQDMAAIQFAKEIGMPIQASTQLSISNYESVKFYSQFANTIVLAREVDLDMMKVICDRIREEDLRGSSGKPLKIEVFVHGALCIAQSGRCQMSLLTSNTSAQRGACLQECRKKYMIKDEETGNEMSVRGGYVMSPKDLCCLPFLDKIVETGVSVIKIEGRGRSPEYVKTVIKVYREAVDAIHENAFTPAKVNTWLKELEKVYNRGFCSGYYLGKLLPDWSLCSGNKSTEERVYVGRVSHYFPKAQVAELSTDALEIKTGDKLVIMGDNTGVVRTDVTSIKLDDKFVDSSGKQNLVTIPLEKRVRKNDKIYLLRKRQNV